MKSNTDKLTDEQMADLLATGSSAQEDAELNALKAALGSYRSETLLWAERRSATQPSLVPAARRNRFWTAVPQWSLAAVAVLTVATAVVHVTGDRAGNDSAGIAPASVAAPARTVPSPQADIAADNQLLSSIDQALAYRSDSPADEFDLKTSSSRTKGSASAGVSD